MLVDSNLAFVFHNYLRGSVESGDQSSGGDVLTKEVSFRPPAKSPSHMSRQYYCELLVRKVSAEEEQVVISFLIMPGGINPSINHGYLAQVVLGIKDRDGLDPVSVIVVPVILGIPLTVITVHAPVPVNIGVRRIVEHIVMVQVSIVVVMEFHLGGRVGIVIVVPSVIIPAVVLLGMFGRRVPWCSITIVCGLAIACGRIASSGNASRAHFRSG